MNSCKKLLDAKKRKDDEFYTPRAVVRKILSESSSNLCNRNILCPCDSDKSEFVKELKENPDLYMYKSFEYSAEDIFSEEGVERIRRADIVVTNPPFSRLRDIVTLLMKHNTKFVLFAPLTYTSTRQCFVLVKQGLLTISKQFTVNYIRPDGTTKEVTTIIISSEDTYKHPKLNLTAEYDSRKYKLFEYNIKDMV